jgi:hypothetical protein
MTDRRGVGGAGAGDSLGRSSPLSKSITTTNFLWSPRISLKQLRKAFGFGSSSESSCAWLTYGWAFANLEKHMLVPPSLSRTYYLSDERHSEWYDYGHLTRKHLSQRNERTSQESLASSTTRQRPFSQLILNSQTSPSRLATKEAIVNAKLITSSQLVSLAEEERKSRFDKQFGPIGSQSHRYVGCYTGVKAIG